LHRARASLFQPACLEIFIPLELEGEVPDLSKDEFEKFAHGAKANCPVSKALAGTEIELVIK